MQDHPIVSERRKIREAPYPHFIRVAKMWEAIIGCCVSPEQVVLCMAALKIAREAGAHEQDNVEDAQGYLHLLDEVRNAGLRKVDQVDQRFARDDYRTSGIVPGKPHLGEGLPFERGPMRPDV